MCRITHIAHILCVHATKETHLCTLQNARSLFSSGSGIPLNTICKHPVHEERWNHDFCDACTIIWSTNEVPESIAKEGTLEYRNRHQYSGPLTPCSGRDSRRMQIVEDVNLTEKQKLACELAWGYNRRHFEKGRVRVEPDESSEFARQLPRWADAPIEEEHWRVHGLGFESSTGSESDASTRTQWPKPKPDITETLGQRREVKRTHRTEDPRFEPRGLDAYEMVRMGSHSLRTVDRDGFETQMLTMPSRPMPGEGARHPASLAAPTINEPPLGRSLTNPRRMTPPVSFSEIKPVQRAGSKFAEQI
jgi:hypothetical protein